MSLISAETRRDIEYGTPLYSATRATLSTYCALAAAEIDRIPLSARRTTPCRLDADGINIHRAVAGRNFTGSYAWSSFKPLEFLFSISEEDAHRYLPVLVQELVS